MTLNKKIPATPASLKAEFAAAGLPLTPLEAERFWQLHELLEERNPSGDLTRVRGFYNTLYKHYIDGAMAAEFMEPEGLTMDLGTGAGFPGLPLAIRKPQWKLLLAEPRGRRLAFMEEVVERLGLDNVEFFPHKVGPRFDRAIDNFVTRDFEPVAASLCRAAAIIPPGGRIYLMKGPLVDEELKEARQLAEWNDFELEDDRAYNLGPSGLGRRLVILRKKAGASRPAPARPWRVLEIGSRENSRFKSWLKSLSGRGLKKNGQALISGPKFVAEIIKNQPEQVAGLIARRPDDLEGFAVPAGVTVHLVRPELFPELDIFGSGPPLAVLNIPEFPTWAGHLDNGLTVFLPFQDPANLGAAVRTATALRARIVLLKEAASPWHPKSLRAAGPSILAADIRQGPSLVELAKLNVPGLAALSPRGENLLNFTFPKATGFVFGIEGPGLDNIWPDNNKLSIPMVSGVESLNAAAAVAVSLGAWVQQAARTASAQATGPEQ